jgi:hypothetical protein
MELESSLKIFEKSSSIKFHENPFNGRRIAPCGQTDMTKLIVVFRNFENASKNVWNNTFTEWSRLQILSPLFQHPLA